MEWGRRSSKEPEREVVPGRQKLKLPQSTAVMIGRVRQRKKRAREVVTGMNLVNQVQEKQRRTSHVHEPTKREGRVCLNSSFAHQPLGTLACWLRAWRWLTTEVRERVEQLGEMEMHTHRALKIFFEPLDLALACGGLLSITATALASPIVLFKRNFYTHNSCSCRGKPQTVMFST